MRFTRYLILPTLSLLSATAAPIIPTDTGMAWRYNMIQEFGDGVSVAGLNPAEDGRIRDEVLYRLAGTEKVAGKVLLKFEMHREGLVTNTDLMTIDEGGIKCAARIDIEGETINLDPPQTIVAEPLQTGTTWDFDGQIDGADVHQHYTVIGEETVQVPAGRFRAFHIHAEQSKPKGTTIDRWFVTGTGIVKDVTSVQNKNGGLQRRISLFLKELPKITPRPEVKPTKKLSAGVSRGAVGPFLTTFPADTPKIYARWQGRGLRNHVRIRALWIAEDIGGDAPLNYTVDEATAVASNPDAHGVFTLAKPESGWAPGAYRVEFYVDDELVETVKLEIGR
jgi:hypothetical protein